MANNDQPFTLGGEGGISDIFNTSVGPAVVGALAQGLEYGKQGIGWLSQQFGQLNPDAQQALLGVGGLALGYIAMARATSMLGMTGLMGKVLTLVGAAATAIYMSSDHAVIPGVGNISPHAERAQPGGNIEQENREALERLVDPATVVTPQRLATPGL
ncbi:MAG: hypothetical protein KJ667_06045 [Alphaproteobacteria bacterium]|nr:hypothetical protein [Alphaproteobacteria bacterium]